MLAFVAAALYNGIFIPSILNMWRRRREPLLKARSPRLCCLMGLSQIIMGDLIFLQDILLRKYSFRLPPSVVIWTASTSLSILIAPVTLRSQRVIVMTLPELQRERQLAGDALTVKSQLIRIFVFFCAYSVISILAEVWRWKNWWNVDFDYVLQPSPVYLASIALSTPPMCMDAVALFRAKDKLGMGNEMVRALAAVFFFIVPYYIIMTLKDVGVLDVDTRVQYLMVTAMVAFMGDAFIFSRREWARPDYQSIKVGSVEDDDTSSYTRWDSLSLVQDPVMSPIYDKWVSRNLCYESFRFLMDASKYEAQCSDPRTTVEEQYHLFQDLIKTHINQGSSLEINISSSMRAPILACVKEAVYMNMLCEDRQQIFHPSIVEISRMLDLNILPGFRMTPEYISAVNRMLSQSKKMNSERDLITTLKKGWL